MKIEKCKRKKNIASIRYLETLWFLWFVIIFTNIPCSTRSLKDRESEKEKMRERANIKELNVRREKEERKKRSLLSIFIITNTHALSTLSLLTHPLYIYIYIILNLVLFCALYIAVCQLRSQFQIFFKLQSFSVPIREISVSLFFKTPLSTIATHWHTNRHIHKIRDNYETRLQFRINRRRLSSIFFCSLFTSYFFSPFPTTRGIFATDIEMDRARSWSGACA